MLDRWRNSVMSKLYESDKKDVPKIFIENDNYRRRDVTGLNAK